MAEINLTPLKKKEYHSSMVFARVGPFPEKESLKTVLKLAEAWSLYHLEVKGPASHSANFWTPGQKHTQRRTNTFGGIGG
jgi:hypothetical protein